MPYIQLQTTKELHKKIKLKAIESGKTIPEYVLECILTVDMSRCLDRAEKELIQNVIVENAKEIEFVLCPSTDKPTETIVPLSGKIKESSKKPKEEFIPETVDFSKVKVSHKIDSNPKHSPNCSCLMCKPPRSK